MSRDRVLLLLGGTLVCTLLVACDDEPTAGPDLSCLVDGRCRCLGNADCSGGTCVNGSCVIAGLSDVTFSDDAPDASTSTLDDPLDPDTAIAAGAFLAPCGADEDCDSEKCLVNTDGSGVCTRTCVDDCPPGWHCKGLVGKGELTFYCFPETDRLCEPCAADTACTGHQNLCLPIGDAPHCGSDCAAKPCPGGYSCADATSIDGAQGRQCVPDSGLCQCTAVTAGASIACNRTNEFGTCPGVRTCLDSGSLTACDARTPEAETCDELDNDCDGFTDEDLAQDPCTAQNSHGTCTGQIVCLPSAGAICNAPAPAEEACDNLDNDCDGETDEDFRDESGAWVAFEHCGACGQSCGNAFANATDVICDPSGEVPACAIVECAAGFALVSPTLCSKLVPALCQPCVDDGSCVGPADKCVQLSPTDPQTFCARDCSAGNVYGEPCPDGYACETVDQDGEPFEQCLPVNGSCDCLPFNEGQKKPCSKTSAVGTCFGTAVCDPAVGWTACSAKEPGPELCDGSDNDCDGLVDEGWNAGPCASTSMFGTCTGVLLCDGAAGTACTAPIATEEICDGVDNDCDGETDEPFAVNVPGPDGEVVALVYSLDDAHCGGCDLPCEAASPVAEAACGADDGVVSCGVVSCEPGFYAFEGKACLPLPNANLCLPCVADGDCPGPADACLGYDDGTFCGRDCAAESIYGPDCPAGFVCEAGQCRRESGACDCDLDGKVRPCSVTNGSGTCAGFETCTTTGPDAGWGPCDALPAPEICDGVDNDCDGLVDGADDSIDTAGLSGYPACENVSAACTGAWICAESPAGFAWLCNAQSPSPETCNGLDDDCDGAVDETFTDGSGAFSTLENCGQCALDCTQALAHLAPGPGSAECQSNSGGFACVPVACESGYLPFPVGEPAVCLPLSASNCQPCSDSTECGPAGDQCVAIGGDSGTFCAQRCDAGSPYVGCTGETGVQGCCPGGFLCTDQSGGPPLCQPANDTCQCSAAKYGLTRPCTLYSAGKECFGVQICEGAAGAWGWGDCDTSANVEVCDGADNDCDGAIDEPFSPLFQTQEHCGGCGKNCDLLFGPQHHATATCQVVAGVPSCQLFTCQTGEVPVGGPCLTDGDCPGAQTCLEPWLHCSGSGPTEFAFVDLDGQVGNGCECPIWSQTPTDDVPELYATWPDSGAVYADRDCDGVDGSVPESLFVRPDGTGAGAIDDPMGSIQQAIDAFQVGTHTHILVAAGIYDEIVTLKNGVQLHGGYTQSFTGRDIVLQPSTVRGRVVATSIDQPTVMAGFVILGADAANGEPTIAVEVVASMVALRIVGNRIVGGNGGAGANGASGSVGTPGADGADGLPSAECTDATCSGGGCDPKTCGGHSQGGGQGGLNAACPSAIGCAGMEAEGGENPQAADAPGPGCSYGTGGNQATYQGGPPNLCKYDCVVNNNLNGDGGADGGAGAPGGGGGGCSNGFGAILSGVWTPATGGPGTTGAPGVGGQGGEAGAFVYNNKPNSCTVGNPFGDLGGSGGGGGAGGCGGLGAGAGAPGGASFAVLIIGGGGSGPDVSGNLIERGFGGGGGKGGSGGTGGKGGNGGFGGPGESPAWCAGFGGSGGRGGDGGPGGGGGGGCGGPSIGIATSGVAVGGYAASNTFASPLAVSAGGEGGSPGLSPVGTAFGGVGASGASEDTHAY